ncbi:MAG: hemolysin family protein [Evtepia sp.]|uniref:HlyC/CorC family transporter n=1 Tax=Evtepia sp. TaxID=2773933 RepID=UPI002A753A2D|nr:hemolysin family protein [Evtepia sp.]MDY3015460.1 hemolysin family protein [Evtepia sp.]
MDSTCIAIIVALIILVALSAWCSSTETAYSSVNKVRLKSKAEDGNVAAQKALALLEQYDKLLSCILIANNIVNLTAATLGTVLFTRLFPVYGPAISTIVLTVVVLIFGEITPKTMAKDRAESFCMRAVIPLRICLTVLTPLHLFFGLFYKVVVKMFRPTQDEGITEEELITMVEEAESEGGLEHHESELIRAAIEFNDMEVEEILTPRVDIVAAPDTITMEEFAVLFAESGYSRIPVYHSSIDNIIGLVHEKDFFSARYHNHTDVTSLISKVFYTTGSAKISDLLRLLQIRKAHMAVVVDDYGGTMGIVTMEDILEELVGEIWDEHDEVIEEFKPQEDGSYLISCSANLDDLFDRFSLRATDIDSASISGWVMDQLGRLPVEGDHFIYETLDVTVTKIDHRRILEIRVAVIPEEEEASP